ncbi:hypothetical protein BKA81DRAFT_380370 [Phyllosticta paracitricarpa]
MMGAWPEAEGRDEAVVVGVVVVEEEEEEDEDEVEGSRFAAGGRGCARTAQHSTAQYSTRTTAQQGAVYGRQGADWHWAGVACRVAAGQSHRPELSGLDVAAVCPVAPPTRPALFHLYTPLPMHPSQNTMPKETTTFSTTLARPCQWVADACSRPQLLLVLVLVLVLVFVFVHVLLVLHLPNQPHAQAAKA